jgi:hypothetical protein
MTEHAISLSSREAPGIIASSYAFVTVVDSRLPRPAAGAVEATLSTP